VPTVDDDVDIDDLRLFLIPSATATLEDKVAVLTMAQATADAAATSLADAERSLTLAQRHREWVQLDGGRESLRNEMLGRSQQLEAELALLSAQVNETEYDVQNVHLAEGACQYLQQVSVLADGTAGLQAADEPWSILNRHKCGEDLQLAVATAAECSMRGLHCQQAPVQQQPEHNLQPVRWVRLGLVLQEYAGGYANIGRRIRLEFIR
jgi:hypothetical protein